jgi:FkbM family methyltransferase
MRIPFTKLEIPMGRFVAPLANKLPFPIVVPVLHGPARGAKWILGSCEPNYWLRSYEEAKVHRFAGMLRSDAVFYDIGANVGYYSIIAAPRLRQVFAFEPFSENVTFLRKHFHLNRFTNCNIVESAVGNIDGTVGFMVGDTNCEGRVISDGAFRVRSLRLDTFIQTNPPPDVIKIDVEGAELTALLGATQMLSKYHPVIFLATHSDELDGDCRSFLVENGYRIEEIEPNELLAT